MLSKVYEFKDNGQEIKLKKLERKYMIVPPGAKEAYEADTFREMVATVCGWQYVDCECAETEWHERVNAAKKIGLMAMTAREMDLGVIDDIDEDEEDILGEDEREPLIVYDERIGKIPYSYTDPIIDYEIHGTPDLIRIESDKLFLYTLTKIAIIDIFENKNGVPVRITETMDIDAEIEKEVKPFRDLNRSVPLHKKLEDYKR